ncbi:MAG: type I DNA topoisomerase, partial [Candidatus Methylomirabilis sp.]|nr:type I DNA topoisomerase [Deltaproteobacteria bacterium]
AIANPLALNRDRYDAQQARRVLDRLVGYQISPILWDKVRRGLSAGRVQSVAVRLVCDREAEIEAFQTKEYWSVTAHLEGAKQPTFHAKLAEVRGEKIEISSEAASREILRSLEGKPWKVAAIERKERRKKPLSPFITSRLQQDASRKLGFSPKKTMTLAQRLYEGVELGEEGAVGLITYMRTDSTRLSEEAIAEVRAFIPEKFGPAYLPEAPIRYKTSAKGAQEAHEAIRPTAAAAYTPEKIAPFLERDMLALYTLIWQRFVACQMTPAVLDQTGVDIVAGDCKFRATGQVVKFPGFMAAYVEAEEEVEPDPDADDRLPDLSEGEALKLLELIPRQHFTQPPPRFNEATLVRELEERGIGRPSTYAAILANIQDKEYVELRQKRFWPTELGRMVNDLLVHHFPRILDYEFTARMEGNLDRVEEGEVPWVRTLREFYGTFEQTLQKAKETMRDVKREEIPTDVDCPTCQSKMVIKWGRRGAFLGCPRYPECTQTMPFERDENGHIVPQKPQTADEPCENCGAEMVLRTGRFGKFFACSRYPECKTTRPVDKEGKALPPEQILERTDMDCPACGLKMVLKRSRTGSRYYACEKYPNCKTTKPFSMGVACPECGGEVAEKSSRRGKMFYGCANYPKCDYAIWDKPIPEPCPSCKAPFIVEKNTKKRGRFRTCLNEKCDWSEDLPEEAEAAAG